MTGFHNISFPLSLAFGASGGPMRVTEITQLANGAEHRNTAHSQSRRKYNAGAGVKSIDELSVLITFFESRLGQLHSFRFRDPMDHKSCRPSDAISATDQIIGQGDGMESQFQLLKTYEDSYGEYRRLIKKPISETVMIALNGEGITASDFNVSELSGEVSFNVPPATGTVISAGFEFDVAVRFDVDQLDLALESFGAGQAANIPLIEVLENA